MITAGIDVGSATAKAVIFLNGKIQSHSLIATGADSIKAARRATDQAMEKAAVLPKEVDYIVSTGYGRVLVPFAHKNISEISCHAKGAVHFFPGTRTILDMGGQDCKVIRCDALGNVENFVMNEKCAAGTGRFMDVMAKTLELPLEDIGELSLNPVGIPPSVSSICVVFARTEILRFLRKGIPKSDILAGLLDALADRVYGLSCRVGTTPDFVITGGVAKNTGMVRRLESMVKMTASLPWEPQIVGAAGAAIFAKQILEKSSE
ncbi:MAG: 2-hydroxyglutaryl-CoA dehydratase [Desulfatitalea sp.]|nr:2-hydroxyglutaryl-CoA dehydratase [Desulfatitalea sp.]NNJ99664.1 2-hydroxyglutaryl-CoA dehydratase [Desulfatitalea sp.]